MHNIITSTGHLCLVNSDISLLLKKKKTGSVTSPKYERYSPFRLYNVRLQASLGGFLKEVFVSLFPSVTQKEKTRHEFHNYFLRGTSQSTASGNQNSK